MYIFPYIMETYTFAVVLTKTGITMKRFLTFFALITALCPFQSKAADATTFEVNRIQYTVTGENTVGVSGFNETYGSDETPMTEVIIPESVAYEGKNYTVTSLEEYAFQWLSDIRKIEMPNTVTALKNNAIYYNYDLEEVVLSQNLTTLGAYALASNSKLSSLAIPAGVTEIPQSCFFNDQGLTTITFAGDFTSIGSGAFYKTAITEIEIPGSCKTIGNNAFQLCPNLARVTLGEGVEVLSEGAFRECSKLTEINLPSSLKSIGEYAFLDNSSLASVTIPAGVTEIGDAAFSYTGVTAFEVEAGNTVCQAINGVLYSADGKVLMAYPTKAEATEYTIADGCLGVGEGAFAHSNVQKIVVPDGMRAFDDNAFSESALSEINFPASLVLMGNQAFALTQLTTLVLPENMTAVYEGTFAQCTALKSITIPASIRDIEAYAFNGCTALTEVFCLDATPPVLNYYEGYDHPFGNLEASQVTVYVPKGCKADYEDSEWGYQFDHIVESATGVLAYESVLPANDSELETLGTLEITFADNISLVQQYPEVTVVKGQELYGEPVVNEGGWMAYASGKTVNVFPADEYQEGVQPIVLESGEEYYVTIPAGIVENADGDQNQKIVLHYTGKVQSGIEQLEGNACFVAQNAGMLQVVLGELSNCTVELFNATGNLVDRIDGAQGSVSFQPAAQGLYLIRVTSGGTVKTFKVVK